MRKHLILLPGWGLGSAPLAPLAETLRAEQAEASEGGGGIGAAALDEGIEGRLAHPVRPVGARHETWVAGQGQQAAAAFAAQRRQFAGEHAAE
jgi:hypothetical protein